MALRFDGTLSLIWKALGRLFFSMSNLTSSAQISVSVQSTTEWYHLKIYIKRIIFFPFGRNSYPETLYVLSSWQSTNPSKLTIRNFAPMPYSVKTREELSLELHREQSFILMYIPAFNRNFDERWSGRLDVRFPFGNQNSSNSPLGARREYNKLHKLLFDIQLNRRP